MIRNEEIKNTYLNESFYVQSDWISMKTIDRKPHIYALLLLYEFVPYEILDLSNEQILFGNKYSERVSWDQLVDRFQTQMPVKGDCDDLQVKLDIKI